MIYQKEKLGVIFMLMRCENITHCYIHKKEKNTVLKDVFFEINDDETVGLVGTSGSGKSTLGQILAGLIRPTGGTLIYQNKKIVVPYDRAIRRQIQIMFQHPEQSFNPRLKVMESVKEVYKLYNLEYCENDMLNELENFGLNKGHLMRLPNQLSGGELQRLALFRVLLLEPKLIILDEPTSMLDVISQAHIIELLNEFKNKRKLSYVFISHDEYLCQLFCDRIYTVANGKIILKKEN